MENKINIDTRAIKPLIDFNETQIILQRHCSYDKNNGNLLDKSIKDEEKLIYQFLNDLKGNLDNTYFLFISSNTINSNSDRKRCVDTNNIAMNIVSSFYKAKNVSKTHIINLDKGLNYNDKVKETSNLSEPKMLLDNTGYLDFLKEKYGGINKDLFIAFEEDKYQNEREKLNAEGPDEIVKRGIDYIKVLQKYSNYFHEKKPNSKLIVWCTTHYDLISPLAKQAIFSFQKSDVINVDFTGGISLKIDDSNNISANVNGNYYPFYFEDKLQRHRHL